MKSIEPGCLAILINCKVAENNGKVVTVLQFLGEQEFYIGAQFSGISRAWKIDRQIATVCGGHDDRVREERLMRIDGFDEQEPVCAERELTRST